MKSERVHVWMGSVTGVIGLIVSAFSLWYAHQANVMAAGSMKLHLEPELRCSVAAQEEGDLHGFEFGMTNEGDLAAVSVSVDHAVLVREERVPGLISVWPAASDWDVPGVRWLFRERLEPNEQATKKADVTFGHALGIAWFRLRFLRETDGRVYEKECVFFRADGRWRTRDEFKADPRFATLEPTLEKAISRLETLRPAVPSE